MLIFKLLTNNQIDIEPVPVNSVPFWYFVLTFDDLSGTDQKYYLTPDFISDRFYTFTIDTTANPMDEGEWVLNVYELSDNSNPTPDVSDLVPSYVSKVRIYKKEESYNYHVVPANDKRNET